MYVCVYMYVCVCMYTCICVYIHIHAYIHLFIYHLHSVDLLGIDPLDIGIVKYEQRIH